MLIKNCNAKILRYTVHMSWSALNIRMMWLCKPPKQNTNNVTEIYTNLEVFFIEQISH